MCSLPSSSLLTLYVLHQVLSQLLNEDYHSKSSHNTKDIIGFKNKPQSTKFSPWQQTLLPWSFIVLKQIVDNCHNFSTKVTFSGHILVTQILSSQIFITSRLITPASGCALSYPLSILHTFIFTFVTLISHVTVANSVGNPTLPKMAIICKLFYTLLNEVIAWQRYMINSM